MHTAISVKNCTIEFDISKRDKFTAVRDCNLDVASQEIVTVVGPSGCGKSTLLFAVDGLTPVTSGTVHVSGELVTKPSTRTSIVFQDFALLPWRTVLDNVLFPLRLRARRNQQTKSEALELAKHYLDVAGLSAFSDRYPRQLSGGMKQRVGIARALATRSDVLLMDEPFASVDAQTRDLMGTELLRIWNEERKAILFVTHSIDEAVYLGDKVAIMTRSPTRVKEIVDVALPRPRPLEIRDTREFTELRAYVWEQLKVEVERQRVMQSERQ